MPKKLIALVTMAMEGSQDKVFVEIKISRNFKATTGVRQGDSLSTVLINLLLSEIIEELGWRGTIISKSKQAYAYPDDIVLMEVSQNNV